MHSLYATVYGRWMDMCSNAAHYAHSMQSALPTQRAGHILSIMLIHAWDPGILMLESPTESRCPGTTSDETATADKRNMPDCTVNNPLVNNPHVNIICTPTPCINTVNNHIHTCPTAINNPSLLYDTLYPTLLHQHSTLVSLHVL